MSNRTLILDTGPLLLFVVAAVDTQLLGRSQHLRAYSPADADLLELFLGGFRSIAITPHVATETAHFVGKIDGRPHGRLKAAFARLFDSVDERSASSQRAAALPEFKWLDLADCSLLDCALPEETLLSMDAQLVNRRLDLGFSAVNFTHLREQAGLL